MAYSFDFDPGTGILHLTTDRHWSVAITQRYCKELAQQIAETRRAVGCLRQLVDLSGMGVQSADVHAEMMAQYSVLDFRPEDWVAICAPPGMTRSNIERAATWARSEAAKRCEGAPRVSFFPTVGAARAWLLHGDSPHAAAA